MRAETLHARSWREAFFLVSVWLKGLDAVLEVVGGCALLTVSPAFVLQVVQRITQDESAPDPPDRIADALLGAAAHLSTGTEHFMALYLLVHGVVKLGLVWGLLRRVLFTYPLSIVIFTAFIAYQLYRYTITHSLGLLALTVLDVAVIVLIYLEYQALRRGAV